MIFDRLIFNRFTMLVLAALLAQPVAAQPSEIIVCAHPKGNAGQHRTVTIEVMRNGIPMTLDQEPRQRRNDKCYLLTLPACDAEITIHAASSQYYYGSTSCRNEPQPIKIAMSGERWQIAAHALGLEDANGGVSALNGIPGFNPEIFKSEILRTEEVIEKLAASAQVAEANLFAALSERNYPEAQLYANDVSEYLRNADEDKLALAYSSITYVAGFRAMGINALAADNPLLTTSELSNVGYVVMNSEGQRVLKTYQDLRNIPSEHGVWDYTTTKTVAENDPLLDDAGANISDAPLDLPQSWETKEMVIDDFGRMRVQP